jgi:hypothetical protein
MERFYHLHLGSNGALQASAGLPPDAALRAAQLWLKDLSNSEVLERLAALERQPDLTQEQRALILIQQDEFSSRPPAEPHRLPEKTMGISLVARFAASALRRSIATARGSAIPTNSEIGTTWRARGRRARPCESNAHARPGVSLGCFSLLVGCIEFTSREAPTPASNPTTLAGRPAFLAGAQAVRIKAKRT